MVLGFVSTTVSPPALIFMGQHQEENEKLLKAEIFSDDVWFHVANMSSAHVYLQLPKGMTVETIPNELIEDCCQLVKKNSINGHKLEMVDVMYTPRDNLKKTKGMISGQVAFHDPNLCRTHLTIKKNGSEVLKRLERTQWKHKS